ncbi:MAG: hypothetical protein RL596_1423 [Bacteroidota bacterium]|jgi:hypothetical protein
MKCLSFIFLVFGLTVSCNQHKASFMPAETGLDAGREFIDGCLKGDFIKAHYYMIDDITNNGFLNDAESTYRKADKEGRQQMRGASINIKELKEVNDSVVHLHYSHTMDTTGKWLTIKKTQDGWQVDYKKSF